MRSRRIPLACTWLLLASLALGCSIIVRPTVAPLAGTSWSLQAFGDRGAPTPVIQGTRVTAAFGQEGRVSGVAGCNSYFGEFKVAGKKLSISALGATKMYCTSPEGVMPQEAAFLDAMARAESFDMQGTELRVPYDGGRQALVFARAE